jgi:hypothetical protein
VIVHGIHLGGRGAAIVTVERADDGLVVTGIERLPFDLSAVADRVGELPEADEYVVDAEGLGAALWTALGSPDERPGWRLYAGHGLARQALVDELVVAVHRGRFHFAPALVQQPAMTKALATFRKEVGADGQIGSELVVALLLAILPPPEPPTPTEFAWI